MISVCAGAGAAWLNAYRGKPPVYACVLSFTETALISHISAAGTTPEARRHTAAADGAYLMYGTARQTTFPPLTAGISPAIISRAILTSLQIPVYLLSTGLPVALDVPNVVALPTVIANAVDTGQAMSLPQVNTLFAAGKAWGRSHAPRDSYLIVGECVVGGTTTAQAVLSALGYHVAGRMSSSCAVDSASDSSQSLASRKVELVQKGLEAWQRRQSLSAQHVDPSQAALHAVAAVGDPMQAVAAGIVIGASQCSGVLLAGGSQMLAVYALSQAIAQEQRLFWRPEQVAVGTTRWVLEDPQADTVAIAQQLNLTYLASQMSFHESPYMQLRAYERGYVKEGVGAGGCAIAAHLYKGWTRSQLRHTVEAQLRQTAFV